MTSFIPIHTRQQDPPLDLPKLAVGDAYRYHTVVKPSGAQRLLTKRLVGEDDASLRRRP